MTNRLRRGPVHCRADALALRGLFAAALTVVAFAASSGCSGDPNDPRTWAKQLGNLRTQKEAMDRLSNMDVERARVALPELIALYKETHNPDHLMALVRFKDPATIPIFIDALDYSDSDFERATIAAGALGEMKATAAVEALQKAAEKELPIKSRANTVRLSAIRALVRIGDKRAVPTLMSILGRSADEQDFLLNVKAALGLAELRDPQAVPALIKGLFMTGRGANVFQECRLALVRIGAPSVDPLIQLLRGKNAEVAEMAVKYKFDEYTPGVVPTKAAWVLGDLRSPKAVPALLEALRRPQKGKEHGAVAIALGLIATPPAVDALLATVKDAKADYVLRMGAADALYMSGDRRAVPTLFELAKSGYVTVSGQKASDLRAEAAVDFSRIAGDDQYEPFKALAEKEQGAQGPFGEALDRLQVAKECKRDLACYGKKLGDPSYARAEKAAFAIGFSGDEKTGVPLLLGALKPLASLTQERFPVHQAILYSLTRLVTKGCPACVEKLTQQIERDEKTAARLPHGSELLGETRVALAVIQNKG